MRGSIGLVVGMALGASAMYLVLRPPWEPRGIARTSGGPPVVVVPGDTGATAPGRRKRSRDKVAGPRAPADGDRDDAAPRALAPADRALEWRGDAVALPPRTMDPVNEPEARPLDAAEITGAIAGQAGGVRGCVVDAATGAELAATITLELLVDGRGRVARSRVHAPRYLFAHGLLGCAQRAAGQIQFPATGAPTIVTLPVHLD